MKRTEGTYLEGRIRKKWKKGYALSLVEEESRKRALMVRAAVHTCGFWYALYVL